MAAASAVADQEIKVKVMIKITNHSYARKRSEEITPHPSDLSMEETVRRIVNLNQGLNNFWGTATGYAPIEAEKLLSKSRLDWQASLSRTLSLWIEQPPKEELDGRLIMGWVNLGSLVEGTMKLFLSVWLETYKKDADKVFRNRKGNLRDPDEIRFESMRQFFHRRIWDDDWNGWVQKVQYRRNAIHAYKDRNIGNHEELLEAIQMYLILLRYINTRLPYPDEMYAPKEEKPSPVYADIEFSSVPTKGEADLEW